jgi:hypothetical protein
MIRPQLLQEFLDAINAATDRYVTERNAKASLARIDAALRSPSRITDVTGARLPVCDKLEEATKPSLFQSPELLRLVEAFVMLEPMLFWHRRSGDMLYASANMAEGHANAVIVGPGGYERRNDVRIGVSLLAPNVRYPDHNHPPDETYLVLSNGDFRQGEGAWFEPGIGGTLYNPPNIVHAMRSGGAPLLAFWLLWEGADDLAEASL